MRKLHIWLKSFLVLCSRDITIQTWWYSLWWILRWERQSSPAMREALQPSDKSILKWRTLINVTLPVGAFFLIGLSLKKYPTFRCLFWSIPDPIYFLRSPIRRSMVYISKFVWPLDGVWLKVSTLMDPFVPYVHLCPSLSPCIHLLLMGKT